MFSTLYKVQATPTYQLIIKATAKPERPDLGPERERINSIRTVLSALFLLEMWKEIVFSPAMMYETPYPRSATGPKPPERIG